VPNVVPVLKPGSFKLSPGHVQAKASSGAAHSRSDSSFEGLIDQNAAAASDRAAQAARHDNPPAKRTKDSSPTVKRADNQPAHSPPKPKKNTAGHDKAPSATAKKANQNGDRVEASDVNKSDKTEKADKSAVSSDDTKNTKDVDTDQSAIDAASAAAQLANVTPPDANALVAQTTISPALADTPVDSKSVATNAAIAATDASDATGDIDTEIAADTGGDGAAKSAKAAATDTSIQAADDGAEETKAASITTEAFASDNSGEKSDTKKPGTDQSVDGKSSKPTDTAAQTAHKDRPLPRTEVQSSQLANAESGADQSSQGSKASGENPIKSHNPAEPATTQVQSNPQNQTLTATAQNFTLPQQPVTGIVAPSATAATSANSSLSPTVPIEGVPIAIANKAVEGNHHFEIRLDPPELGRIEVRLNVDRDGVISSHVIADRQDTLDLLRRDPSGLERTLQDAGLKTSNDGLQFSLRDHSNGQEQRQNGANTAHLVLQDESLPAAEIGTQTYGRLINSAGGLDIRV
jgi:flagellar hook-length control protein FliK